MQIIAHRGASAERPENSLLAVERALEVGVDAIELDLLCSKDGRLIIRHDDLVQQAGRWHYVRELTLAELQQVDLGAGERIPTLEQALERLRARCPLFLDLKAPGLATRLADFLRRHSGRASIHVTSALHAEIAEIARLRPDLERSIVVGSLPLRCEGLTRQVGTTQLSLPRSCLEQAVVEHLRAEGLRIRAYPVNLRREAETFAAWGVEGIFTDDPAVMRPLRGTPTP